MALKLPSLLGRMDSSEKVNRAALLTIKSWMDGEADSNFVLKGDIESNLAIAN